MLCTLVSFGAHESWGRVWPALTAMPLQFKKGDKVFGLTDMFMPQNTAEGAPRPCWAAVQQHAYDICYLLNICNQPLYFWQLQRGGAASVCLEHQAAAVTGACWHGRNRLVRRLRSLQGGVAGAGAGKPEARHGGGRCPTCRTDGLPGESSFRWTAPPPCHLRGRF